MANDKTGRNAEVTGSEAPVSEASKRHNVKQTAEDTLNKAKRMFIDEDGDDDINYTGDELTERDYRPIRRAREGHTGIVGGILYFIFIACVAIVLAVFMWMAVADALALNGSSDYVVSVTLPAGIFNTQTIEKTDENGAVTGTERIQTVDIDYVAEELKAAGIIEYKWLFKAFCNLSNAQNKIDAGEYTLKGSYDYRALIQAMRRGARGTLTVTVTIPEGFTMRDIFLRLEDNGVCSMEDLYEAAANTEFNYTFLADKPLGEATRLEGYLFPDTYEFYVDMNASSAIKKFLDNFKNHYTTDMEAQLARLGLSLDDAIKVASIIEKEAGADAERGNIASVIYNRLKSNMQLGLDSTILYVYPDHEGAPNAEMLADTNPYNTRINFGLPPTAISNPGMASITAAVSPTTTSYFYFALEKATGTMQFFRTYNEFNAFVAVQNYDE